MDVARCIYEANLVAGDILPIISLWPESEAESKYKSRLALACLEVLVPLTWPMEKDKETMTVNHHRHMPVLEMAQVAYKSSIINYDGARVLHAAVRLALPSMAVPIGDRTPRDQGIIKLVLFFLRNIAMIAPLSHVKHDGDEAYVSRSSTIDAFSYQDIFLVLLTLASNMGEEFRTEDTSVMEIIYHLVKRVDVEKLYMNEKQLNSAKSNELSDLMKKESAMLKAYNRKGPTRHSRFGTMVWVKREDGKMSSLSGQDALADAQTRNQKLDNTKKYKPPRRGRKDDKNEREMGLPPKLNARANEQLRSFVEEFLDSSFNPLFMHVRKTIDREAPHVMQYHRRQFFYVVAWFLEAERMRRKDRKEKKGAGDVTSFNLIAGVLNQEMFITLNKGLHEAYEFKDWHELAAVMRCFTQILLTVQEMVDSGNDEDQEIAENVLSRLFYEEATHDAIANIIRSYKDQGFDYLDAATELVHHFLRILEAYSKQNVDMQVRSRKRTRQKKKAAEVANGEDGTAVDVEGDESADDTQNAEKTTKERKFDFHRFANRFSTQGAVDTFVKFLKFYQDLSDTQLKRTHRFLYRVAFKLDMSVMLFRVDVIHLLYNMIKGQQALDKSAASYKEWEELVKQILRKCFKKIEERPELLIELLFSKQQGIAFFLEYGYERQTSSMKAQARPAAELEFKNPGEERDRQVAIVVGAMLDKNESDHIAWLRKAIESAETERRVWADANEAIFREREPPADGDDAEDAPKSEAPDIGKSPPDRWRLGNKVLTVIVIRPDNEARQKAMFKNSHLRLLMTLAGCQRADSSSEETPESTWIVPAEVSADHLKDSMHFIQQAEFSPPTFDEHVIAENLLRRKTVPRKKAAFDDDNEDEDEGFDDAALFPPGGPTARKVIDADKPKKKKKLRQRRQRDSDAEEPDQDALDEKARKRRDREREKAAKIKSALYVNEGDDEFDSEEDEAFFARERQTAAKANMVAESAGGEPLYIGAPTTTAQKKRKSEVLLVNDEDDDNDDDEEADANRRRRPRGSSDVSDERETEDTHVEGSDAESGDRKKRRTSVEDEDEEMIDADAEAVKAAEEEEDAPVLVRRPRVRGGFIVESDTDDE